MAYSSAPRGTTTTLNTRLEYGMLKSAPRGTVEKFNKQHISKDWKRIIESI